MDIPASFLGGVFAAEESIPKLPLAQINCGLIRVDDKMAYPDPRRGCLAIGIDSTGKFDEISWFTRFTKSYSFRIPVISGIRFHLCENRVLHMTSEQKPADNRIFWIQETDPGRDAVLVKHLNDVIDKSTAYPVGSVRRPRPLVDIVAAVDRIGELPSPTAAPGRRPFVPSFKRQRLVFDPHGPVRFRMNTDVEDDSPTSTTTSTSTTSQAELAKVTEIKSAESPSTPARSVSNSALVLETPGPISATSSSDIVAVTPTASSVSTLSVAPPAAPSKKRTLPVMEISAKVKRTGETQSIAEARITTEDKKLSDESVDEQTTDDAKEKNEQDKDEKQTKSNTQTTNNTDMELIKDADVNNIAANRRTKRKN